MCLVCRGRMLVGIRALRGMASAQQARALAHMVPECANCTLKNAPRRGDTRLLNALLRESRQTRADVLRRLCNCSGECTRLAPKMRISTKLLHGAEK